MTTSEHTSKRALIRREIINRLKNRTRARENVRANRGQKNWQENLPAINVYIRGEDVEQSSQAPRLLKRLMTVEIECIDEGRDGNILSDKLDELIHDVETLLGVDDTLNDTVNTIVLSGISDMDSIGDGSTTTMAVKLQYAIEYYEYVPSTQAGQNVTDLNEVDATWTLEHGNEQEPDKAKDKIIL